MIFLNLLVVFNSDSIFSIQGKASDSGSISLRIIPPCFINITSPLNGSYYEFNYSDIWAVDLNVSANCDLFGWNYSVYSYYFNETIYSQIDFVPNSTAVLYSGLVDLIVLAVNEFGDVFSAVSTVYVNVSNSAPILNFSADELFLCENNTLSYEFSAYDADGDELFFDLFPINPFFVLKKSQVGNYAFAELFSLNFNKIYIDSLKKYSVYELLISVYEKRDFDPLSDFKYVNVTVFEINNPPVIENIGSKTVWLKGENSSLDFRVKAFDREEGISEQGNLDFNISFHGSGKLFDIDNTGNIFYTPIQGQQGIYLVTVCVNDNGFFIDNPNFSVCLDQGYTNNSLFACDDFFLTVTDENRPPEILDFYPNEDYLFGNSNTPFYFNVSSYDSDLTIPDIYWYVGEELLLYEEAKGNSSFYHLFGCGVEGIYNVSVVVSDGALNVSRSWKLFVDLVECPEIPRVGLSGGGPIIPRCEEKWACNSWEPCKSLENDFFNFFTPGFSEYSRIKQECEFNSFVSNFCGFQIRDCFDLNSCNNRVAIISPPELLRVCYFTPDPSCYDGIKNCHSGGCEVGIDCGGPCPPCPSCSDGKQNQGEEGIDCGGPCPNPCLDPLEKATNYYFILVFILIGLLILILFYLVIYKLYIIFFLHKEDDEKKRK